MNVDQAKKEADAWMKEHKDDFILRSCWKCNPAHKHLKDLDAVIWCFECGNWYWKGVNISEKQKMAENKTADNKQSRKRRSSKKIPPDKKGSHNKVLPEL